MSVKLSGLELREFLENPEGENEIFEDDEWTINGNSVDAYDLCPSMVKDNDICVLRGGVWFESDSPNAKSRPLESVLRQWLKRRGKATIIIEVDTSEVPSVIDNAKRLGWRIVK